jgi:DNA repair protein RecO (recombination protein O)
MQECATGLILRTYPLTETSLIVNWLTAEQGRIATVAKGARRPKSPFRGKLDLYFLADFSFIRSRRSELHNLCEVALRETHDQLRRDLGWLHQAAYAAALIEQFTEPDTPLPEIFTLLQGFLQHLPRQAKTPRSIFALEIKLLAEMGLIPDWPQEKLTPGTKALLKKLAELDWHSLSKLHFSDNQTAEAAAFLKYFLARHLDRVPAKRETAVA